MTVRTMSGAINIAPSACSLLTVAATCGMVSCRNPETVHPTSANIPPPALVTARVGSSRTGAVGGLSIVADRLESARPVHSVDLGATAPDRAPVVRDVVSLDDHTFALLWAGAKDVILIDTSSSGEVTVRQRLSAADGTSPVGIVLGRSSDLIVIDQRGFIASFAKIGSQYVLAGELKLRIGAEDICRIGESLYARGSKSPSRTITRYSLGGTMEGGFGEPYQATDSAVRQSLSTGEIACSAASATIVTMFHFFPYLYGYSPRGQLKWITFLEEFRVPLLIEKRHMTHTVIAHRQVESVDRLLSLMEFGERYCIVQTIRIPHTKSTVAQVHSYVVDVQTGSGRYIGSSLDRLFASRGSRLFGIRSTKESHHLTMYEIGS